VTSQNAGSQVQNPEFKLQSHQKTKTKQKNKKKKKEREREWIKAILWFLLIN
jgi:hypothetical protein